MFQGTRISFLSVVKAKQVLIFSLLVKSIWVCCLVYVWWKEGSFTLWAFSAIFPMAQMMEIGPFSGIGISPSSPRVPNVFLYVIAGDPPQQLIVTSSSHLPQHRVTHSPGCQVVVLHVPQVLVHVGHCHVSPLHD